MEQNQEKLTDEAIAKMVQRGERETFGWLLERYEEKMKRYARRFLSSKEDISDITQEVFIKVYKNIQQFNPARPFKPWPFNTRPTVLAETEKPSLSRIEAILYCDPAGYSFLNSTSRAVPGQATSSGQTSPSIHPQCFPLHIFCIRQVYHIMSTSP